ncbi:MAG: pantoate--beta-alanine ligase [Planctomycetaceae bacterium]|jgi:pantoate--beta-alanine ligase|nr:pantoate--beta-alanine ligase [Planctomycetaceae bacterium]
MINNNEKIITAPKELFSWSCNQHKLDRRIGIVPTMGGLHEGHISLIRTADRNCDSVIVSIFVNPMQFGQNEDFNLYPRNLEADINLIESANLRNELKLFIPQVDEIYPAGFNSTVHVGSVTETLEGYFRPKHFDGVATVVLKLFNISCADTAYFGAKDYQQVCVIKKMTADLNIPIDIITCPTIRDVDGVALSSRNIYLSTSQRVQAAVISQSLLMAENLIVKEGCKNAEKIIDQMRDKILSAADTKIDYATIVEPITLKELKILDGHNEIIILLAVKIGSTRLIDNKIITGIS